MAAGRLALDKGHSGTLAAQDGEASGPWLDSMPPTARPKIPLCVCACSVLSNSLRDCATRHDAPLREAPGMEWPIFDTNVSEEELTSKNLGAPAGPQNIERKILLLDSVEQRPHFC